MDGETKKRSHLSGAAGEFSVKQEVAILCAVEALQPHHAPLESAQSRWQEVAERVKHTVEGDVDGDACQRYYLEVMASMRAGQQQKRPRSTLPPPRPTAHEKSAAQNSSSALPSETTTKNPPPPVLPVDKSVRFAVSPPASVVSRSPVPATVPTVATATQGLPQQTVHGALVKRRRGRPPKSSAPPDTVVDVVERVQMPGRRTIAKELAELQARAEWIRYEEARKRAIERGKPPPPTPAEKKRMAIERMKRLEKEKAERERGERKARTAAERKARKQARERDSHSHTSTVTAVDVEPPRPPEAETVEPQDLDLEQIPTANREGDEGLEAVAASNDRDQSISPSPLPQPNELQDEVQQPIPPVVPATTTSVRLSATVCTTQLEEDQSTSALATLLQAVRRAESPPKHAKTSSKPPPRQAPEPPASAIPATSSLAACDSRSDDPRFPREPNQERLLGETLISCVASLESAHSERVALQQCESDPQAPPDCQVAASTTSGPEAMKQTIAVLLKALESSRRGHAEFQRAVAGVYDREDEHSRRINDLSTRINVAETERSKYEHDLSLLRADFEQSQEDSTKSTAEAVKETSEVALLKTHLAQIQSEFADHKQSFEEYKSRESVRHVAFMQTQIFALRGEVAKVKETAAVDKGSLEARLAALETERLAFRAALEKNTRKRDELMATVATNLEDYQTRQADQFAAIESKIISLGDALMQFQSTSTKRDERSKLLELERDAQAKLELRELREALQSERSERTREYTSLLHSINQILKGEESD